MRAPLFLLLPLLLLALFAIACDSADHKAITRGIGDRKGTHVVSNVIEAPAGASWKRVHVQTLAYRSNDNAHVFNKRWAVWTDLWVEYGPESFASTRLKTLQEEEASVDEIVAQARRNYQLRLVRPEELEFSTDGGATWTWIPVPSRNPPAPTEADASSDSQ